MICECHITTTVAHSELAERLIKEMMDDGPWKTSEIKRDPVLGPDSFFYLTAHDTDCIRLKTRMMAMATAMRHRGMPVLREKIELVIFDTKAPK